MELATGTGAGKQPERAARVARREQSPEDTHRVSALRSSSSRTGAMSLAELNGRGQSVAARPQGPHSPREAETNGNGRRSGLLETERSHKHEQQLARADTSNGKGKGLSHRGASSGMQRGGGMQVDIEIETGRRSGGGSRLSGSRSVRDRDALGRTSSSSRLRSRGMDQGGARTPSRSTYASRSRGSDTVARELAKIKEVERRAREVARRQGGR